MITRFHANNFRCLVNFEAKFDSFAVLCGHNGAGKSSVFDALELLRNLGTGDGALGGTSDRDVRRLEFTNWQKEKDGKPLSDIQEFQLGLNVDGHDLEYVLHIEQKADFEKPRIVKEEASCDDNVLFTRDLDGVAFEKADGSQASFPLDWRQAALAVIQPRSTNLAKAELLQNELARLLIVRPSPRSMLPDSRAEAKYPNLSMTDIISWYRSLSQDQQWTNALSDSLKEIWPDFLSFKLVDAGLDIKALQLRFEKKGKESSLLFFDQLSDGERALVGLYMIRAAMQVGAIRTALIDEPDNFVGLPELQPWVLGMRELLDNEHQLILISHHPEILSSSGEKNGYYLWRDNHTSPTRIGPLQVPEGLTAGEAIARGWASGK